MPELTERNWQRIDDVLDDLCNGQPARYKLTKCEATALISGFSVYNGTGALDSDGGRKQSVCFLQTANVMWAAMSGERPKGCETRGDAPDFQEIDQIDPLLENFGPAFNDAITDTATRTRLLEFVPRLFNTSVGPATEARQKLMRDEALKLVAGLIARGDAEVFGEYVGDYATRSIFASDKRADAWEDGELEPSEFNKAERSKLAKQIADGLDLASDLGDYYGANDPEAGFAFLDKLLRVRGSRKAA